MLIKGLVIFIFFFCHLTQKFQINALLCFVTAQIGNTCFYWILVVLFFYVFRLSVPFLWMWHLRKTLMEILQMCQGHCDLTSVQCLRMQYLKNTLREISSNVAQMAMVKGQGHWPIKLIFSPNSRIHMLWKNANCADGVYDSFMHLFVFVLYLSVDECLRKRDLNEYAVYSNKFALYFYSSSFPYVSQKYL